jgi:hypothetical protein
MPTRLGLRRRSIINRRQIHSRVKTAQNQAIADAANKESNSTNSAESAGTAESASSATQGATGSITREERMELRAQRRQAISQLRQSRDENGEVSDAARQQFEESKAAILNLAAEFRSN